MFKSAPKRPSGSVIISEDCHGEDKRVVIILSNGKLNPKLPVSVVTTQVSALKRLNVEIIPIWVSTVCRYTVIRHTNL